MISSMMSTTVMEDIAHVRTDCLKWFQLYPLKDNRLNKLLVKKVENMGFKALVVTVDTPVAGIRYKDKRNKFRLPSHLQCGTFEGLIDDCPQATRFEVATTFVNPKVSWSTVDWLKSMTRLPIVLKGILTAEDAQLAVEHGASAIILSNHGGRQLDGVLATVSEMISLLLSLYQSECPVLVDMLGRLR